MGVFKLLVIDDEVISRRPVYERVLGQSRYFELEFVENFQNLYKAIGKFKGHGFILDVCLEDKWHGADYRDVIKHIGGKAPIILVSKQWITDDRNLMAILNDIKNVHSIVHFFAWSEFKNAETDNVANALISKITRELCLFHNRTMNTVESDETIVILHISDLQFGDTNIDKKSFMAQNSIPRYLYKVGIEPHLLFISGDISFSGKPSEFEKAYTWIKTFCEHLNFNNNEEKLLLVPGNHDFDMQFCAGDLYKFDFKNLKYVKRPPKEIQYEHRLYGLLPFRDFAYRITGDLKWLTNQNNLNWVNDIFLNWGIRLFHLNSVSEITPNTPQKAHICEDSLENICTKLLNPGDKKKIFNIVLSHHGPMALGFKQKDQDKRDNWDKVRVFLESVQANLFLYGHEHANDIGQLNDTGGDYSYRMIEVTASTLLLNQNVRKNDKRRGFHVIELYRKNNTVEKVKIRPFEISEARFMEDKSQKYEWDIGE